MAAPHLIDLDGPWQAWRVVRLRAAGFPAAAVDALAMPNAARSAASVELAEQALAAARGQAADRVRDAATRDGRAMPSVDRLVKQIEAGEAGAADWRDAVAPYAASWDAALRARRGFADDFARDRREVGRAIRGVLADPRFVEAVTWQNRQALGHGLHSLATTPVEQHDKRTRQREQAVAMYLQRYCVKNDTIGFFGPVSWATLSEAVHGVAMRPAPEPLARRTVYFEYWGIKALADRIAEDRDVLPWMAPRLHPGVRLDGRTLHHPVDGAIALPLDLAALLDACDGTTRASALAARIIAAGTTALAEPDEVYAALAELADHGLVIWSVEVSPEALVPEQALHDVLARIDDDEVRSRARAGLDRLDARRRQVAEAAGEPAALGAALDRLDAEFEALAGVSPRRHDGQTYGGRQLVYEDCRRGIEVELGQDLLAGVAPACGLLLHSARWYTYEIARRYRSALGEIYDRVSKGTGQTALELRRWWEPVQAVFPGGRAPGSIVGQVALALQRTWAAILEISHDVRRVDRAAEPVRARVAEAFAAPGPGWPNARYQSLDLMIAAAGAAALDRGDYLVVLGELHAGMNTVLSPVFCKEYPAVDRLLAWRADDLAGACIAPAWSFNRSRADYFSMVATDLSLETGAARSWRPRDRVVTEGECVVERVRGELEIRTRDGRHRFDVIAFLEHHLIAESHAHFQLTGVAPHSPRVTLGGLVLAREAWRMTPAELAPIHAASPEARFLAAQAWARQHGLPRHVFAKVPEETKPFFVDLASSLAIENLARIARRASSITLSEMLPAPDELWLEDAGGQRFTSELRLVAVDPVRFAAP